MTTVGKVAIGAAVVIGGYVAYKLVTENSGFTKIANQNQTPKNNEVSGFLNLATSAFNYFTKNAPQAQQVPGSRSTWDSTGDWYLPLAPGEKAYADSTANDNLLA